MSPDKKYIYYYRKGRYEGKGLKLTVAKLFFVPFFKGVRLQAWYTDGASRRLTWFDSYIVFGAVATPNSLPLSHRLLAITHSCLCARGLFL